MAEAPAPEDAVDRTRERVERALRRGGGDSESRLPVSRPERKGTLASSSLPRAAALTTEAVRERVERRLGASTPASPEPGPKAPPAAPEPQPPVPSGSVPDPVPSVPRREPPADYGEPDALPSGLPPLDSSAEERIRRSARSEFRPRRRSRSRLAEILATCAFIGRLPLAPGTWGSAAGLGAYYACRNLAAPLEGALLAAAIAVGIWSAGRYAASCRRKDPQEVVVDEFCGMWLTLVGTQASPVAAGSAFDLFRLLDIAKPPPIRQAERLPGGLGIMADDLVAALGVRVAVILAYGAGFL